MKQEEQGLSLRSLAFPGQPGIDETPISKQNTPNETKHTIVFVLDCQAFRMPLVKRPYLISELSTQRSPEILLSSSILLSF